MVLADLICTLQTNSLPGLRVSEQRGQHAEERAAETPSAGCPLARAEIDRPGFLELWREPVPYHHAVISWVVGTSARVAVSLLLRASGRQRSRCASTWFICQWER